MIIFNLVLSINLKKEDKEYLALKKRFENMIQESNNHSHKTFNHDKNEAKDILQTMKMEKLHRNPVNSNKNINSLHLE